MSLCNQSLVACKLLPVQILLKLAAFFCILWLVSLLLSCATNQQTQATIEENQEVVEVIKAPTFGSVLNPIQISIPETQQPSLKGLPINRHIPIPDSLFDRSDWFLQKDSNSLIVSDFSNIHERIKAPHAGVKIAVILPFSDDRFAAFSNQLKQGIMKAYFQHRHSFQVRFIDSLEYSDLKPLYRSLVWRQFDAILGPLLPQSVQQIEFSDETFNVPFNQVQQALPSSTSISIDLSLRNQWQQLVNFANDMQLCNALVLVDSNSTDLNEVNNLTDTWFQQGKKVLDVVHIGNQADDNTQKISNAMHSNQQLQELWYADDGQFNFSAVEKDDFPFIRQDVDVIFSFLNFNQNQTIVPVLNLLGGELPIILSNAKMTLSSQFNPFLDADLNGLYYLDRAWRYQQSELRLFEAMGYDALILVLHLLADLDFEYQGYSANYRYRNNQLSKSLNWYRSQLGSVSIIN